jgi:hypothetical protein
MQPAPEELETDPRFPSGPWVGFWTQKHFPPGKFPMELHLTFSRGEMHGEGRDMVGKFVIRGKYSLGDGACHWHKRYLGRHDVYYDGFNEGKGIWGKWEIVKDGLHGGFHIWPEGTPDPTQPTLTEAADIRITEEQPADTEVPALSPAQ